jgi:hypothetical protein
MLPTSFPEQNFAFNRPTDMTDEECSSLPVWRGEDANGLPVIISKWMPSEEDIEAINRGESIYLQIVGNGMPPVCLFTENPFITESV